jgi:hypothetical protein
LPIGIDPEASLLVDVQTTLHPSSSGGAAASAQRPQNNVSATIAAARWQAWNRTNLKRVLVSSLHIEHAPCDNFIGELTFLSLASTEIELLSITVMGESR